jgi:hypothetical protein
MYELAVEVDPIGECYAECLWHHYNQAIQQKEAKRYYRESQMQVLSFHPSYVNDKSKNGGSGEFR